MTASAIGVRTVSSPLMAALPNVAGQWQPDTPYLDTASCGLPPRVAWDELQRALADWRHGRASWEGWNESTDRARRAFARIVGVDASAVAVGATVSELVGLIAAS